MDALDELLCVAARLEPRAAAQARVAAAEEGLELVMSSSVTGWKCVMVENGRYKACVWERSATGSKKRRYLGCFTTPEEAALAYSRHIGPERAAAQAAVAKVERPVPLTAEQAQAAAKAEGLELIRSDNTAGYKGVCVAKGRYQTSFKEGRRHCYLGSFTTPEEAALEYVRHIGPERAAAEAAWARSERRGLLAADVLPSVAAKREHVQLVRSDRIAGLKGVASGKHSYDVRCGAVIHLGCFDSIKEAALELARQDATLEDCKVADQITACPSDAEDEVLLMTGLSSDDEGEEVRHELSHMCAEDVTPTLDGKMDSAWSATPRQRT